jgi:TonB family protein
MYFDFDEHRPDTPRIPSAVSLREGVLLSIVVHLLLVIAYLLTPDSWFERVNEPELDAVEVLPPQNPPLRFVEVMPLIDRQERPVRPADQSDLDRRSSTIERAPEAFDPAPLMRGNTPEMVVGGPRTPPAPPPSPPPAPARTEEAQMADASQLPPSDLGLTARAERPASTPVPSTSALSESLRDLQQYLRDQNFNNPRGGNTQQSADIQFDSMGIDFGPWLRRFKNQVERNWIVPAAAMTFKGRVVVQFNVLRNGTIRDLVVLQPAPIPALTNAAVNSLRLSNPTAALPPEYPADRVLFTVTFHYNEDPRSYP